MDIEKILEIVKKTGKEVVFLCENGESYVVSRFDDYYGNLGKNIDNYGKKTDDDYAVSVKKLIMP